MITSDLLLDLGRLGIRLEADGKRLRYFPRSAVTPDLLARLKAHKPELLELLRTDATAPPTAPGSTFDNSDALGITTALRPAQRELEPFPIVANRRDASKPVCRCGSTTSRDVPIHGGESIRRDCGRCGRFLDFPIWYGEHALQNAQ